MMKLSARKIACGVFLLCVATAIAAPAQTFTTLHTFEGTDGGGPFFGSLVQGKEGMGWGTTSYGGADGGGTVFRMAQDGSVTTIYDLCGQAPCPDGETPDAGLVLGTDGNFYGTTSAGGTNLSGGTVFKITPSGALTTLYAFCTRANCPDGAFPFSGLLLATDGNFYGTTYEGGNANQGTVFKLTKEGVFTTLYSFCSQAGCVDGGFPQGGLVQATDGSFYGTTVAGGANLCLGAGCGTIFRITSVGEFNTLHSFDGTDGANPTGTLIQATDGNLYGTTYEPGTVFRISLNGLLTTLASVPYPLAGLIQGTDGNFYGTTAGGGNTNDCDGGCGTLFEITTGGALTTLHSFDNTDGNAPSAGLAQATNGVFYGTTFEGGSLTCNSPYGCGTIFSLDTGLGPFLTFVRAAGRIGQTGGILGQGLTGTISVSLNGTPAAFTVKSDTFLEATVPAGATTGYVTVTTPTGTLTSNVPFHVLP
jgi:uncharacterized repeat protein (TIGR03803 family)